MGERCSILFSSALQVRIGRINCAENSAFPRSPEYADAERQRAANRRSAPAISVYYGDLRHRDLNIVVPLRKRMAMLLLGSKVSKLPS